MTGPEFKRTGSEWFRRTEQTFVGSIVTEAVSQRECEMDDQTPQPNAAVRARDTVTDVTRTGAEISAALVDAVGRLVEALERARRPHRPLGMIAAMTREAPLSALFVAILLGVAIGRRH
jgi:hypothetical protein